MEPEIILRNLEAWLKSEHRRLAQEELRSTRLQDWLSAGGKRAERVAIASVIDKINEEKERDGMILKCTNCAGSGQVFHQGKAKPEPCWNCADDGLIIDAIIALMRAHGGDCRDEAIKLVCDWIKPKSGAVEIWGKVKERLGQW